MPEQSETQKQLLKVRQQEKIHCTSLTFYFQIKLKMLFKKIREQNQDLLIFPYVLLCHSVFFFFPPHLQLTYLFFDFTNNCYERRKQTDSSVGLKQFFCFVLSVLGYVFIFPDICTRAVMLLLCLHVLLFQRNFKNWNSCCNNSE